MELLCSPIDDDAIEFCNSQQVDLKTNKGDSKINFNYVLDYDQSCPRILQNISLVKFSANRFIIFYGCSIVNETLHDEGAWILGYRNNSLSESMKYLDEAFGFLSNSSVKLENFRIFNETIRANDLTGKKVGIN